MFQWNKLELFWTSTFEVNAKGNCCNAFGTVLVVIKTNGHRLNLFIQIFNFQNIYFPKLIYVHWSLFNYERVFRQVFICTSSIHLCHWFTVCFPMSKMKTFIPSKNRRCFNMLRPQLFSAWYCRRDARQWTKRSPLKHGQTNMVFNWWLYFKRIKLLATARIIVGVSLWYVNGKKVIFQSEKVKIAVFKSPFDL